MASSESSTPPAYGRVRWRRFGVAMLPAAAVAAVLVTLTAKGAVAASFSVSGQQFIVTATKRPTLTIHQKGSSAVTSTSLLSFSGHVVLYATKLSGDLLGVPVTLTASSPLSLVLRLLKPLTQGLTVTMTNVVTDQPLTTASASRWANFLISVRPV